MRPKASRHERSFVNPYPYSIPKLCCPPSSVLKRLPLQTNIDVLEIDAHMRSEQVIHKYRPGLLHRERLLEDYQIPWDVLRAQHHVLLRLPTLRKRNRLGDRLMRAGISILNRESNLRGDPGLQVVMRVTDESGSSPVMGTPRHA